MLPDRLQSTVVALRILKTLGLAGVRTFLLGTTWD